MAGNGLDKEVDVVDDTEELEMNLVASENDDFTIKSKALELAVQYCQTEGLLEITKQQRGERSKGLPTAKQIVDRARVFEEYLSEVTEYEEEVEDED